VAAISSLRSVSDFVFVDGVRINDCFRRTPGTGTCQIGLIISLSGHSAKYLRGISCVSVVHELLSHSDNDPIHTITQSVSSAGISIHLRLIFPFFLSDNEVLGRYLVHSHVGVDVGRDPLSEGCHWH
jgi:hypothetical protein